MIKNPNNEAFKKTWPGGYSENFVVYEQVVGGKESDIVQTCLAPFYGKDKTCLEIGCGEGFWLGKYLVPNFKHVTGLDVIPREWVKAKGNYRYIELPNTNYACHMVADNSVDFVWSFGCFCHLTLPSIQEYLKSIIRVLKPGGKASLYFSNTERRPGMATMETADTDPDKDIIWADNNWNKTRKMMKKAGFVHIKDLMPDLKDTMAYGEKP